jgi:hypothetical protein
VVRPFGPLEIDTEGAHFSTEIAASDADALLSEWGPHEELMTFHGPSAWYTAEPRTNPKIGVLAHADQRSFLTRLQGEQLLHHAHEDVRFRVPHMTHDTAEITGFSGPRAPSAASVVSNYGGPIHNRGTDIRLRNAFATAPGVVLFGRRSKWRHYRPRWWSVPRAPATYKGEVDQQGSAKIDLLARFQSAVCLENTIEPHYFSEKFVDAVRAGCVPIYRAHPTVREGVLRDALYVDPADFELDVGRTLEHALTLDREEIARHNWAWLETEEVRRTSRDRVWAAIAEALSHQAR